MTIPTNPMLGCKKVVLTSTILGRLEQALGSAGLLSATHRHAFGTVSESIAQNKLMLAQKLLTTFSQAVRLEP